VTDPHFSAAKLVFETGNIKLLRNGTLELQIFVPHDQITEALKLRTSFGLLLEGTVKPVKRKEP
jgi:hypothetical protein